MRLGLGVEGGVEAGRSAGPSTYRFIVSHTRDMIVP